MHLVLYTHPGEDWKEWKSDSCLHIINTKAILWGLWFSPSVGQVTKSYKVQEWPKTYNKNPYINMRIVNIFFFIHLSFTWESQVSKNIMLTCLDTGHLLKQILSDQEAHGSKECNDGYSSSIVACIRVIIVQADVLLCCIINFPSLRWYATEYYDTE